MIDKGEKLKSKNRYYSYNHCINNDFVSEIGFDLANLFKSISCT